MKIGKKYLPPLALLMISLAGTAYAIGIQFKQSAPDVPVKGLTSNCSSLTSNRAGVLPPPNSAGNPFYPAVGGGPMPRFSIFFDCSQTDFGATPAFSVAGTTQLTATLFSGSLNGYSGCTGVDGMSKIYTGPVQYFQNRFCIYPAGQEVGAPCTSANDDCVADKTCDVNTANSGLYMVAIPLGSLQTFSTFQNWNYCLEYANPPTTTATIGLGAFTIQWM
ncbi:MAG: hypothetical protein AUI93_01100 [Crenarchaeota archaeon 13_1_40CM_3_52_10]|nr:MAG: hypothetical protein AUI93_01100 [Crenarchaeota archaeon 13_1_40CM_3_52_10]